MPTRSVPPKNTSGQPSCQGAAFAPTRGPGPPGVVGTGDQSTVERSNRHTSLRGWPVVESRPPNR
jgi:hypothetical protein